jgi:hypothetical protein
MAITNKKSDEYKSISASHNEARSGGLDSKYHPVDSSPKELDIDKHAFHNSDINPLNKVLKSKHLKGWIRLSIIFSTTAGALNIYFSGLNIALFKPNGIRFQYDGDNYRFWGLISYLQEFLLGFTATFVGVLIIYFVSYKIIPWVVSGFRE